MIIAVSPYEMALSKAAQRRTWEAFQNGGTTHSARAATLPFLIRKCELEKVPYRLTALPGVGYFMEPTKGLEG